MPTRKPQADQNGEALSGEIVSPDEDHVDEKLVEKAVEWIRGKVGDLEKSAVEIGQYVLDTFFSGDPEAVSSKNPKKEASFRALVKKCNTVELPISRTTLNRFVNVALMTPKLPDGGKAFLQLPPTHQGVLLPLREDPGKVEKLAQRAVSKGLSVKELQESVAEAKEKARDPEAPRIGRKPTPLIVKTLDRSLKLFTRESGKRTFNNAHFAELSEEQVELARQSAQDLMESLKDLVSRLKKA